MNSFLEKLFFKKRNIYAFSEMENIEMLNNNYAFKINTISNDNELEESQIREIKKDGLGNISPKMVINRLSSNDYLLFIVTEKRSGYIAGSYWAYLASKNNSWNDTLCLNEGEVLLCNAYVNKTYRRQGLYGDLVRASHKYLKNEVKPKTVYTIVEQSNSASDSVNRSFYGKAEYVNYLFKLLSINIFSVLKNKSVFRLYFVPLGRKMYEK